MTEQAKEARREYKRRWAAQHPEKVKAQQDRYWEKRAQQQSEPDTAKQGDNGKRIIE